MQKYGKHTKEVMEVVDFIRSGGILKTEFQPDQFNEFEVEVIYSLSLDEQEFYCDPNCAGAKIEGGYWMQTREKNNRLSYDIHDSEFFNKILPLTDELSKELFEEITEHLENLEDEKYFSVDDTLMDWIAEDLQTLIENRARAGKVLETMDEKLFKVYQASGYPVGWSGKFPDGKLVVYSK